MMPIGHPHKCNPRCSSCKLNDDMIVGLIILVGVPIAIVVIPVAIPVWLVGRTANYIHDRWFNNSTTEKPA